MDFNQGIEKLIDNIHCDDEQFIEKVVEEMNIDPFDITPAHYSKISLLVMEHEVKVLDLLKDINNQINQERKKNKRKTERFTQAICGYK